MREVYIFFLLVVISFAAFLVVYPFTMVGGDEGRFMQDALRMGRGEIPIADYGTRAPILSWFINAFTIVFGRSLFIFRLPVILFSALTTGFLFLLGKELFSKNIGIIAALVFTLVPFTLWNNVVIKTEALATLLVVISAFFLLKGLRSSAAHWFVFSGIAMGLAYIERHTVAVFILTAGITVLWHAISHTRSINRVVVKEVFLRGSLMFIGVILGFLPIFLYIASHNMERAREAWLSYTPIAVGASTKKIAYESSNTATYGFLRSWGLSFVESLAVQAGLLFVSFVVFLFSVIQVFFDRWKNVKYFFLISVAFVFFGSFMVHSLNIYRIGTFRPNVFLALFLFSLPVLFLFLFYEIFHQRLKDFFSKNIDAVLFLCFWIFAHILAFSLYAPGYMRELIPQFSLITGVLFFVFPWRMARRMVIALLFVSLGGLWGASISWYTDPVTGWWWRQKTINDIASFLAEHTKPDDRVFTANPLPVVLAGRRTVADISSYAMVFAKDPYESYGTFPSPHEMLEILRASPPLYTLVDGRMESHFFRTYPFFEEFVYKNYKKVATFGTGRRRDWTEVWELQEKGRVHNQ